MAEYELLQQVFPEGVALRIMRFRSHPVADMLKSWIEEWQYYKFISEGQLLEFVHYWQNERTLEGAREQYLYNLTRTTRRWKDHMYDFDVDMPLFLEHMSRIPIVYVVTDEDVEEIPDEM